MDGKKELLTLFQVFNMQLEIIIPSKGRVNKLTQCLNSIFISAKNIPVILSLYFSIKEELEHFQEILKEVPNINLRFLDNYKVPDFCNKCFKETKADAIFYCNDDILLFDDTLKKAISTFEREFQDYDGILALSQANLPESQEIEGIFAIVGTKFSDRFPRRQLFCPSYYRFRCDKELMLFSQSIGKFRFYPDIKIKHIIPDLKKNIIDETHKEVRSYLIADNLMYEKRKKLGYLWGKNFNLIKES